jgi:hypothetical protein
MVKGLGALIEANVAAGAKVAVAGPASDEAVQAAESMLGVALPPSYRGFLARFGAVEIDGRSFAGLTCGDVGSAGDVVAFTTHARDNYQLPAHYVALDFQDGDAFLCIDTEQRRADGESPIVLVSPSDGTQLGHPAAESWTDYLADYLSS